MRVAITARSGRVKTNIDSNTVISADTGRKRYEAVRETSAKQTLPALLHAEKQHGTDSYIFELFNGAHTDTCMVTANFYAAPEDALYSSGPIISN